MLAELVADSVADLLVGLVLVELKLVDVNGVEAISQETVDVKSPLQVRKRDDIESESKFDDLLDGNRRGKGRVVFLKKTRRDLLEAFWGEEARRCQRSAPTFLSVCPRVR